MNRKNFADLPGGSDKEKFTSLSVENDARIDILDLKKIGDEYGVEVVVYFEKDLAENSTYEKDLVDFGGDDEEMRPFITAEKFIKFGTETDPTFESRLTEFPLMVRIISTGERQEEGESVKYIKGLMPFLDDFDVDSEPGPFIGS